MYISTYQYNIYVPAAFNVAAHVCAEPGAVRFCYVSVVLLSYEYTKIYDNTTRVFIFIVLFLLGLNPNLHIYMSISIYNIHVPARG